jgi:hypothetical protein
VVQRTKLLKGTSDLDLGLAPVALEGLQSMWYIGILTKGRSSAHLNIVETAPAS